MMRSHHLTEKAQGHYHYTIGPYSEPVLRVKPGDRVTVETLDAFGGKIKNEKTKPSQVLEFPNVNPLNGPIFVEGAEKGDALKIQIKSIKPRGGQPRGTTCLLPFFGGLSGTQKSPTLQEPLPEIVHKVNITEREVSWSDRIRFPYDPFIGTIGTSPELDSINSLTPESHGGNMDLPDVRPGNTIYLPVRVPGARLFLGDCHATQGDGELCGVAIEFPTETTITIDLVKGWTIQWPRIENKDIIMSVGSGRPMEEAAKIAYADLLSWMEEGFGFDRYDAYFVLTQIARARLGNMVDPNYTIAASIGKQYLLP
jgi:acetamidase/formamidase